MDLSPSHFASRRTSGTTVVFPAPGGACRTAALEDSSVVRRSGTTESIGSGGVEMDVVLERVWSDALRIG